MTDTKTIDITENIHAIHTRMSKSAEQWQRPLNTIQLIAVSKFQPVEKIEPAIKAGQHVFGENRVQEAHEKWITLKAKYPSIELHLIGPLQTNKIHQALDIFDVIETVDRPKLAEMLAKGKASRSHFPECFIQVNVGKEAQKTGILPQESDDFIRYCINDLQLPITGLMCIPPANEPPAPYFALLATIAKRHHLPNLSMGMSSDFESAIACGATHIRVGEAIFGPRHIS